MQTLNLMPTELDEAVVVKRLIFESITPSVNNAYRKSLLRSLATIAYLYIVSRFRSTTTSVETAAPVICYGFFKNELSAIDAAVRRQPGWQKVHLDLHGMEGLDWKVVFKPAPWSVVLFIKRAFKSGGWIAVQNFAYPFVGLLLFRYFETQFRVLKHRPTILTTNLVHPLSVAVHLAAVKAGLPTAFWEHSMTPRFMARDMGYDRYYVHCAHTRQSFLEAGVPGDRLALIEADTNPEPVPLGDVGALTKVGVSVNDLDSVEAIEQVVNALSRAGKTVILRVHDSDNRLLALKALAQDQGAGLSNARDSAIAEFMSTVDLVVAGNSNVVLDCLRARLPVIYYWSGDPQLFDYYGIVAASQCERASSIAALASILKFGDAQ